MPPRQTWQDFDQDLLILFDAYVHGDVDRRGFLNQAQRFAKAGVTAAGLLAALSPNFAAAQLVRADDARLKIEWVTVPSPAGSGGIRGYLVRPVSAGTARLPVVLDERINAAWPAYEAALKAAGARVEMHQYPGTQHGFNNDTTPRYDAAAAQLAWERTLAFFKRHLA